MHFLDVVTGGRFSEYRDIRRKLNEALLSLHDGMGEASARQTIQQRLGPFASILDYRASAALSTVYTTVKQFRTEIIRTVDEMKGFYLVSVMLDQIVEDALAPDVSTNDVVTVSSKNREVQREIEELNNRFQFDHLVNDIAKDLLAYGEYTLRTEVEGPGGELKGDREDGTVDNIVDPVNTIQGQGQSPPRKEPGRGLVGLYDDVDQEKVIAVTETGNITGYITVDDRNRATLAAPHQFVKFTLSGSKIRVELGEDPVLKQVMKTLGQDQNKIPKFVRVGRSVVYPVLSKLKELQLLEQLVPATKLAKLTSGTIVGVQVPTAYDIRKGFDVAAKVEDLLNKKIGVDTTNNRLNVENIINTVGQMKAVPLFGDKGQMQKFDYKPEEPDDLLSSIEDVRKVIMSGVGIPYEIVFGSDSSESKGELLKRYARYMRRLKNIQAAIAEGLKQIVFIHLVNKGISFVPSKDVDVKFRNKLIQVDLLDELEFLDTTVTMLGNAMRFFGVEDMDIRKATVLENLLMFLQSKLGVLELDKAIDPKKAKEIEAEEDEEDDDFGRGPPPPPAPAPAPPAPAPAPEPEPEGDKEDNAA